MFARNFKSKKIDKFEKIAYNIKNILPSYIDIDSLYKKRTLRKNLAEVLYCKDINTNKKLTVEELYEKVQEMLEINEPIRSYITLLYLKNPKTYNFFDDFLKPMQVLVDAYSIEVLIKNPDYEIIRDINGYLFLRRKNGKIRNISV